MLSLFALSSTRGLGEAVAAEIGVPLARHEERDFEDGEHKTRPLESVRGKDVFVLESLHGDSRRSANDKLCRLLFFLGALKDAGAERLTAVTPYLCYARKDRRTKPRDPVTTRYVAAVLEAVGADRVVVVDVHSVAAFQNSFRIPAENLEARKLLARHGAAIAGDADVVVVSPDAGGVKRADRFRQALEAELGREVGSAFLEKYRSAGVVSGSAVIGDVGARVAIIVDDLISTGRTLARAAGACRERGAGRVFAAATHGIFASEASGVLADSALDGIWITDTIPPERLDPEVRDGKVTVLPVAPLLAAAIRRLHESGSIVDLLET